MFVTRDAIASDGGGDAWTLRQEALGDGLRVLIAEDGLLLAGTVTGICPPDIYGVAVDGERGCRPRILSTEELLRLAVRFSLSLRFIDTRIYSSSARHVRKEDASRASCE